MNEPTIRLPSIDNCKSLIRRYIKHNAYVGYDWLGSPDAGDHDTLTRRQRKPIDDIMHANAPEEFWRGWLDRSLSEELRDIPNDLDLVDCSDCELEPGINAVFELVRQMAAIPWVRDAAPTKALHLLRPRFVTISDRYVRITLGIGEDITRFSGRNKAERCAARVEAVQRAIRALAQDNAAALDKLHAYANRFAGVTAPDLLNTQERREAASKPPVQLSKARVLDILLWSRASWGNAG